MRYYEVVYFATSSKSSSGAMLPFEHYPAWSTHNTEFVTLALQSVNMMVKLEVCNPAV